MSSRSKILLFGIDPKTPPAVYGEILVPGATRTLVLYTHYDGVPVTPANWKSTGPFQPVIYDGPFEQGAKKVSEKSFVGCISPEWRVYGRASSDNKAGVISVLHALDALSVAKEPLTSNVKLFFDSEEESGSIHLGEMIDRKPELFKTADAWIVFDGPAHHTGKRMLVYGFRGGVTVNLTVYGPKKALHSGLYGNWAPNPALMLATLLASMKDERNHVLIDDFYAGMKPLGKLERPALAALPKDDQEQMERLGFARSETPGMTWDESLTLPSLNIRGMKSAEVGAEATHVIPADAFATFDLRVVKGIERRAQVERFIRHVQKQGYWVLDRDPTDGERLKYPRIAKITSTRGNNAITTPLDLPLSRQIEYVLESSAPEGLIKMPLLGGSLPLFVVDEKFSTPIYVVPVGNADNHQHAEDENLRLGNLWDGIKSVAAILTMTGKINSER